MLRLRTFGTLDLRPDGGKPVRDLLGQPKRLALLITLALEGRRGPVPRDLLLARFWPESDEGRARNALSQALHHLRLALGGDVLESHGTTHVGLRAGAMWCDAAAFDEALARDDPAAALALYAGDFCPGLAPGGGTDVEQWLDAERSRYARAAVAAAETLAAAALERGDRDEAARRARWALALPPLDEQDLRSLLLALERAGDAAGALRAYSEHAERLRRALDDAPEPATQRVAAGIRERREAAVAATLRPAAAAPHDAPVPAHRPGGAEPRAPAPRWSPATLALGLLATIAAVVIVVAARHTDPQASTLRVAVLPFSHHGASSAYLGEGLVDLLSATLDGSDGLRAIDPRAVIAAARAEPPDAPEADARLARRLGAGWYISGDVTETAGRLQLRATLYAVGGGRSPLATAAVVGDSAALFGLVDDLAGRLLASIVSGRDTTLTRLAAVTTHSLPALKLFLGGERELRRGRDAQAAAAFRDAALLDTTFALAQYRLALTSTWVTVPDVASPSTWAELASRNARRLTPLARDLLAAFDAYKDLRAAEAERLYRALLAGYPDNVEATMMLGEVLFHYNPMLGRSASEGRAPFERVLALEPDNPHALLHLARLAAAEGRRAQLDSLTARFLARFPDADRAAEARALAASGRGDRAALAAAIEEVRQRDDIVALGVLTGLLQYAQDLSAAPQLASRYAGTPRDTSLYLLQARRILALAPLAAGRWGHGPAAALLGAGLDDAWRLETEALLAAEPALAAPVPHVRALRAAVAARAPYPALRAIGPDGAPALGSDMQQYLLGLLDAQLGDTAAARAAARRLAAETDAAAAPLARQLAGALRAELARRAGRLEEALRELEAIPPAPRALLDQLAHWGLRERFLRAELLDRLGRAAEAATLYDSYVHYYDLPYAALAHLRLGGLLERAGERGGAHRHYERALRLWQDPDPFLRPLREQARLGAARTAGATP